VTDTPETPDDTDEAAPGPSIGIAAEMRTAYLDYAMSVIVARAIPDLRDGLKPVHRRILYAMQHDTNNTHDKPYQKSARAVGVVMGNYHPHGDAAIYDALVRMAQDFSMSLPLLDGQGNFGSMDGGNPAAMRYTEVRMAETATALLADIGKDSVDFQDNYDGKDREPVVLPARFPNLLVNGAEGIAVGMATRIPPHNLGEVIDATLALIDDPDLTSIDLMAHVPGPDFPTGGVILGQSGARRAYTEGRGSVILRARTHVEDIRRDRPAIIIDEIPYQVNKERLCARIGELAREKAIEGVADVRDETGRAGVRVVIELKRDATPEVVLNQLWRLTPMQIAFPCNMLALNGGRPEQLTLRGMLTAFLAFREEAVARRTAFELREARARAHVQCGVAVAVANVDEVVATIRSSADPAEARARLMERRWPAGEIAGYIALIDDPSHRINEDGTYNLSEIQARAILDLRLQRLTALGTNEIGAELEGLAKTIQECLDILRSRARIQGIIADELRDVKDRFAVPRRTEIIEGEAELEDEDLIEREDMVVTVTAAGYIKRTPLTEYRAQRRGGKGLAGMATREDDVVTTLFVANTHTPLLVFTGDGMVYKLKVAQVLPRLSVDLRVLVVGPPWDPAEEAALCEPRVKRLDALAQPRLFALMRGATAVVIPNLPAEAGVVEGFGLIAAEAAAQGAVVLAAAVDGYDSSVVDGTTGLLLPPGDAAAWAAAIADVQGWTPERRAAFTDRARLVARSRFDWARTARATLGLAAGGAPAGEDQGTSAPG
jgi:DNA gyrase subunit A